MQVFSFKDDGVDVVVAATTLSRGFGVVDADAIATLRDTVDSTVAAGSILCSSANIAEDTFMLQHFATCSAGMKLKTSQLSKPCVANAAVSSGEPLKSAMAAKKN
jgi:hypothetical protein